MCGRYTLAGKPVNLESQLRAQVRDDAKRLVELPNYNVAPSAMVPVLLSDSPDWITTARWGLHPSWSRNDPKPRLLINIREDSLRNKPVFKRYIHQQHCLIPATGFYEWRTRGKQKQAFFVHLVQQDWFCFAGVYEYCRRADGHLETTVSLITTEPNALMEPIHDRMPVIIPPEKYDLWLNSSAECHPTELLLPYPTAEMEAWPVSSKVNIPSNNDPSLLNRVEISDNNAQLDLFS